MTSQEISDTMLEKVKNTMGLVFVYGDDYLWLFKDGKCVYYGHSISSYDLLRILNIPSTEFSFVDDEAAEIFGEYVQF